MVEAERRINGKVSLETRSAFMQVASLIIENSLTGSWMWHFKKTTGFAPENLAIVRHCSQLAHSSRVETRRCWTINLVEGLVEAEQWVKLTSIAMVEAERRINGKVSLETRYYISSLESHAGRLIEAVRTHWGIENSLHWVLDVGISRRQLSDSQRPCS